LIYPQPSISKKSHKALNSTSTNIQYRRKTMAYTQNQHWHTMTHPSHVTNLTRACLFSPASK